jgi:hypothetical protein
MRRYSELAAEPTRAIGKARKVEEEDECPDDVPQSACWGLCDGVPLRDERCEGGVGDGASRGGSSPVSRSGMLEGMVAAVDARDVG